MGTDKFWRVWQTLQRRPMVGIAVLFMAGIALHTILPVWPGVWLGAAAPLATVGLVGRRLTHGAIAVAILATGVAAGQIEHYCFPHHDIAAYLNDEPRLAELELQIHEPPRLLTMAFGPRRPLPPRQVTTASVLRVRTLQGWRDSSGRILLQIDQPIGELAVGQHIRALGILQRPAPAMNPGQFDWQHYYRDKRILASLNVPRATNVQMLSPGWFSPLAKLREQSRLLLGMGFSADRSLDHALLAALLLGDGNPELRDVQEQFRRTGTSHHLAISGMHIAILGGFVFLLCRLLCWRPRIAVLTMTAFVIVYGLAAMPSPPVIRSVLLCVTFGAGVLLRRSLDAIQLLALSVLAMLVYHPLDLYNAGFQLSFGTVLGLMIFTPRLIAAMDRPDDLPVTLKPTPVQTVGRRGRRELLTIGCCGIVAWTVSAPLIAYHFEQLNPYAIPASIALAPVVLAALLGGLFKVVLTLLCPWLAGTWAMLSAGPIIAMRCGVQWLGMLPGSDMPLPTPPLWAILIYYAALIAPILPLARGRWRWGLRAGAVAAASTAFFLPVLVGLGPARQSPGDLKVTVLSVGAGQCVIVEPAGQSPTIIDAGSDTYWDLSRKCVNPFLRHLARGRVQRLLLSHSDLDHISAAGDLAATYDVREILIGPYFRRFATPSAHNLLETLERDDRPAMTVVRGQRIDLGRDCVLEVLWPPTEEPLTSNNCGLVLRLTCSGRSILFPGDIQADAQRELLKNPDKLRSDILIAPHHGSAEKTTRAFIQAVAPRYIISSNDSTLTQKQRDFDRHIGDTPLLRTHRSGAVTVTIDRSGKLDVETFLPAQRR